MSKLSNVERHLELKRKQGEAIARVAGGGIPYDQQQLELERLQAINEEIQVLEANALAEANAATPPPPPVIADIKAISPVDAAARAAERRARPEFFSGRRADGTRLTAAEQDLLTREVQELTARAAETDGGVA